MSEFEFTPEGYVESMLAEIHDYVELQRETARATAGVRAERILELGIGTGETTRRVLELHPGAHLTGIDSSAAMLARAREAFPAADLRVARLEDPLPEGPFDLVVSTLAVHHLDSPGKADLFRRVAAVLRPGGRFVLADVVVPERPEDVVIELLNVCRTFGSKTLTAWGITVGLVLGFATDFVLVAAGV